MNDALPPPHQSDPIELLTRQAYYQITHTLFSLLPPPLADTQDAMIARNDAAIAKIAVLAPVNVDEADIAAHCIAARAQAEDVLRLIRLHAGDVLLVMKLQSQYALMERTAGAIRTQLARLQAARQKREPNSDPAAADEWMRYIAARSMQQALDRGLAQAVPVAEQSIPALSGAPPAPVPSPAAPDAPAPPAQLLAAEQSPARSTQPPPAQPPPAQAPPASDPAAAPPRRHRPRHVPETEEQSRDLDAEADYYAIVYPDRARLIRQCGGLPPNCTFGPPDDALLRAIVTGTSATLRALDAPVIAAA